MFLCAGNLLFKREFLAPNKRGSAARKAELILSSYKAMGCEVLNVGAYDLALGIPYLRTLGATNQIPLVSANLTDAQGTLLFERYRIREVNGVRVGIFGLLSPRLKFDKIPDGEALRVRQPRQAAAEVTARLQQEGAEFIVLLTDLKGSPLRSLAQAKLPIDLIIGSDKRNRISLPMVTRDTFITHLDRGGRSVGHLEVSPQPAGNAPSGQGKPVRGRLLRHQFIQLRLDMPDAPEIAARVTAFEQREATLQQEQLANNTDTAGGDCGNAYVGIARCATCHADRFRTWQGTHHAHALATLVARNRQYDAECLACHVLAYECDAGSLKIANVEEFANVQCESCHGPGELHAASGGEQPTRPLSPLHEVCLRCHTPEHSDGINFATMASRICAAAPP